MTASAERRRNHRARWPSFLIVVLVASCGPTGTPLRLESHETFVRVRVEFLGEYPSDIESIELRRAASGQVVWRLEPVDESFQLYNFDLRAGQNATQPAAWGKIESVAPQSDSFVLEPNTPYELRVCAHGWYKRCAETTVVLPVNLHVNRSPARVAPR